MFSYFRLCFKFLLVPKCRGQLLERKKKNLAFLASLAAYGIFIFILSGRLELTLRNDMHSTIIHNAHLCEVQQVENEDLWP